MTASSAASFKEKIDRLDQIVETVRSKETSLERSLDLLDEAIGLGLGAVELVDSREFSADELARVDAAGSNGGAANVK